MAHTGYTIQMKTKEVKLHLKDGSILSGQIFVSEYSPRHAGEEKTAEFFEQNALFFPLKIAEEIILLSKNSIVAVEYISEDDLSIYKRCNARVITFEGKIFSLSIPLLLPNPSPRLSDQINQPERFLLCTDPTGNTTFLINKSHIASIQELK